MLKKTKGSIFVLSALFSASLGLIWYHKKNIPIDTNWEIFYTWLIIFLISLLYTLYKLRLLLLLKIKGLIFDDYKILLSILLIAVISRFLLLSNYPFISLGDELRDAGLNAVLIQTNTTKDLFAFGSYEGYGNFIPLISYFFMKLLGANPLIYKVPSAIAGMLSVLLTYIIAKKIGGRKMGIVSAIFLSGSLVHLHYSRTELLVVLDSLLATIIVLTLALSKHSYWKYLLIGLLVGFSLHFYVGIRALIFIVLTYIFMGFIKKLTVHFMQNNPDKFSAELVRFFISMIIILIGMTIALGPRLNNMTKNSLGNTVNSSLIFKDPQFNQKNIIEKLDFIKNTYTKAFLTYFSETTTIHFQYKAPLIQFPWNWFFLIGIFSLAIGHKWRDQNLRTLILLIIFFVPIPNQVLINQIGGDHRMMSVLPFLSIAIAFGVVEIIDKIPISPNTNSKIVFFVLIAYLIFQTSFYYIARPSDIGYDNYNTRDYIFQSVLNYIQNNKNKFDNFYILNDDMFNFGLYHHEALTFNAYPKRAEMIDRIAFESKLYENTLNTQFITFNKSLNSDTISNTPITTRCDSDKLINYICPKGYVGIYQFFIINK